MRRPVDQPQPGSRAARRRRRDNLRRQLRAVRPRPRGLRERVLVSRAPIAYLYLSLIFLFGLYSTVSGTWRPLGILLLFFITPTWLFATYTALSWWTRGWLDFRLEARRDLAREFSRRRVPWHHERRGALHNQFSAWIDTSAGDLRVCLVQHTWTQRPLIGGCWKATELDSETFSATATSQANAAHQKTLKAAVKLEAEARNESEATARKLAARLGECDPEALVAIGDDRPVARRLHSARSADEILG